MYGAPSSFFGETLIGRLAVLRISSLGHKWFQGAPCHRCPVQVVVTAGIVVELGEEGCRERGEVD